jgi:hypothetical protein
MTFFEGVYQAIVNESNSCLWSRPINVMKIIEATIASNTQRKQVITI